MRIRFVGTPPDSDAIAVGLWQDQAATLPDSLRRARAASPRFAGKEGECLSCFDAAGRRWLLLGLGTQAGMDAPRAMRLGVALHDAVARSGARRLVVMLGLPGGLAGHVALGLRQAAWRPPSHLRRPLPEDEAPSLEEAMIVAAGSAWDGLCPLADAVDAGRNLAVLPGNLLGPAELAAEVRGLAALGCDVQVMDAAELRRQGLGLLAAVGQGSASPPCLAVAQWHGSNGAPLAFVGKGITFDTGGLSIKHGDSVHEMKGDMAGAAAALMTLRVLAQRRAPVNAAAVLAIAENSVSGRALRPGDVLRSYAGSTVEVADTDAEGRLVLADALAWTCARLKPRAVVDLATLTGAVVTTLGHHHAGLFSPDDALAESLLAAGRRVGEPLWRLPLIEDAALKSDIADIRNAAWGTVPDALHAAQFLRGFVPAGVPWAHLDIAGVAEAGESRHPTGFGVRLLVDWATSGPAAEAASATTG